LVISDKRYGLFDFSLLGPFRPECLQEGILYNFFVFTHTGTMGVRRLFSRGGQNFPGGQKHTICLKNA